MSLQTSTLGYIGRPYKASTLDANNIDLGNATVQQGTGANFADAVTVNGIAGRITLDATATLGAGAVASIVVTNSGIRRNGMIFLQYHTDAASEEVNVTPIAQTAGAFTISLEAGTAGGGIIAGVHSVTYLQLFVD